MHDEQFELQFKVAKHFLDQLGLPLGWQLLVEVKLLNDHVVVSLEGLFDTINPYEGQDRCHPGITGM